MKLTKEQIAELRRRVDLRKNWDGMYKLPVGTEAMFINLGPALLDAAEENQQLRELLRDVEWRGEAAHDGTRVVCTCPVCGAFPEPGHATDCKLAEALR